MPIGKKIQIEESQKGQRLDKFLAVFYPEKSRTKWQKAIREKSILVNGKKSSLDYILKRGDSVEILKEKLTVKERIEIPDIKIIYEDNNTIVLDKPAGILAQSALSSQSPSVTDFLKNHYPQISEAGEEESRFGIVHRLDKDTSGIMIAAKNNKSFEFLKSQFKKRYAQKTYLALTYGIVKPEEGTIDLNIGRSRSKPDMQTVIDGKKKEGIKSREALTLYKTVKKFPNYSLLEVQPKTGRMHQIRVHLKAIGYPIVGDKKYFFKKYSGFEPKLKRQFLHAAELEIRLPDGAVKKFKSDLSQDLRLFLDKIQSLPVSHSEIQLKRLKSLTNSGFYSNIK